MNAPITVHFDDIIFQLQSFGGASEYWSNITRRVKINPGFQTTNSPSHKLLRGIPVLCNSMVFHSSHFRTSFSSNVSSVSTVHDMNYELGYLPTTLGARLNILERRRSYFTAQTLICISQSTKAELLQVYPQLANQCPIEVIHHGCEFVEPSPEHRVKAASLGSYILYVGGRQEYKRFDDLLLAFEMSGLAREGFRVVCTGAPFTDAESARLVALGLSSSVSAYNNVPASLLSALYEKAYCLVYPSVHEGFGMPLIEAMQHGCPVIACNVSCIPEITSDSALLVAPEAPDELAAALLRISNPILREEQIEKGRLRSKLFSWDASARAHMNVYQQVAHRK